jgi:hypothetical protein
VKFVWENTQHLTPRYFHTYLGGDRFNLPFKGQVKGWLLRTGTGAYQDTGFENLIDLSTHTSKVQDG